MSILRPKKRRPPNYSRPYFIPLRSSFTKLRHIDVSVYVIVSIEKTRPICVTVRLRALSISAKIGSLKVRHISETATQLAIVIIS